jgi:hypothetical protein
MRDEVARKLALSYEELTAHCSLLVPRAWSLEPEKMVSKQWLVVRRDERGKKLSLRGAKP